MSRRDMGRKEERIEEPCARFGENLYWGWSSVPGWVPGGGEAVTSW